MFFSDVVAQDELKDDLIKAIDSKRLPHALLLLGESGYGGLSLALALAQYLMCDHKKEHDSCGECNHCHKAQKYIHPDIHFTFPTIGSKVTSGEFLPSWRTFLEGGPYQHLQSWLAKLDGENKQGNINKDECDRIIKILNLKTYEGSHKILIIWMAEHLGDQGNRLLKILEEPPENTHFILIAERQEAILNTILSRCQIVNIRPLPDDAISNYLMKHQDADQDSARQAALFANGNLIEAIQIAGHTQKETIDWWLDWMRLCYKGNGLEIGPWVDKFSKLSRESQKAFMRFGLHFLREMLLQHTKPDHDVRLLEKERIALVKMSKLVEYPSILAMVKMIEENIYHVERNINGRILLMDSSIRLHYLLHNQHARLEAVQTI